MQVGVVASLRRYPVKSMLGEELGSADLAPSGVRGDRAFALIDEETGKVVSVKRPKRWERIFQLTAESVDAGVQVRFPDGRVAPVEDPQLAPALSEFLGRRVSVSSTPPAEATFDEAWERELKNGIDPFMDLPSRVEDDEGELIDAGQFMGPMGNFFNFGAVHLVSTGTTRQLEQLEPGTAFAPHRFRPNIVVDTEETGFLETGWQGRTMTIGDVVLNATFTVPRCVMTTLAQGELPADRDVLRAVSRHNPVDVFGSGTGYPCVGIYADVVTGGEIRPGMPVLLQD